MLDWSQRDDIIIRNQQTPWIGNMAKTTRLEALKDVDSVGRDQPLDDLDREDETVTRNTGRARESVAPAIDASAREFSSGGQGGRFVVFFFVVLLLASIGILVTTLVLDARRSAIQASQVEMSSRLLMLSQRVSRQAREATLGSAEAFNGLEDSRAAINAIVGALDLGDPTIGVEPLATGSRPLLQALSESWQPMRANADTIVSNRDAVLSVRRARDQVNELVPLLLAQSDEVVETMVLEGADPTLINLAGRQRTLTQRIRAAVNEFALGEAGAEVAATQFGRDLRLYGRTIRLLEGRVSQPARAKIDALKATYQELSASVEMILAGVAEFFSAQLAARGVGTEADRFLEITQQLVRSVSEETPLPIVEQYIPDGVDANTLFRWVPWVFGALSAVLLLALVRTFLGRAQSEARVSSEANRRTQEAVMNLLDEMSDLADGDLTIQAEVTDQVTGAIADSVNFAVEEMRNLVMRIKQAAESVTSETRGSRETAESLTVSAEQQLKAINTATGEIQLMAQSMAELSA
ncbi:MAG: hypothetical protein DWQ08_10880, partial [Proteobacteria bacterium]